MAMPELKADTGVVVTLGIITAGDRCALVIPMATPATDLENDTLCASAADAVISGLMLYLTNCLVTSAYVRYINAEAMMNGKVPYRGTFGSTEYPGARTGVALPSNVAALGLFYSYKEQDDPPTQRTRVGKMFLPGISATDVEGDLVKSTLKGEIATLLQAMVDGFDDSQTPTHKWYRALAVPRPRPTDPEAALARISKTIVPGTVATQRRRLLPQYT